MTRVAVQPEMLRWACERAGFDIDALTHRIPQLPAWERGEKQPTFKQLEAFAKATHTPFGFLFLAEPRDIAGNDISNLLGRAVDVGCHLDLVLLEIGRKFRAVLLQKLLCCALDQHCFNSSHNAQERGGIYKYYAYRCCFCPAVPVSLKGKENGNSEEEIGFVHYKKTDKNGFQLSFSG